MDQDTPIEVSIICNTYNHEAYIRSALDGFMMQNTTFPFEVLIHDDASTDHTADIIREYEKQYPGIIKPVFQEINQYSKGIPISLTFQYPRVSGRYIALCEGDDYWTESDKLQKQFEVMERHPEIDMCAHASTRIDAKTGEFVRTICAAEKTCIIPAERVIREGGGLFSTNSLMYRVELVRDMPEFRKKSGLDYTIQIQGALRGGILYLQDNMSVYRANVANSWIDRMRKNPQGKIKHKKRMINMLIQLNKDTNGKYFFVISKQIIKNTMEIVALSLRLREYCQSIFENKTIRHGIR